MAMQPLAAARALLSGNAVASSSRLLGVATGRSFSSTRQRRDASGPKDGKADMRSKLTAAQQRAYDRLHPVIAQFEAPVDLALAYGSGVVAQANAAPGVSLDMVF